MVTFLLVCNLALWLLNTLETSRTDAHPIQVRVTEYSGASLPQHHQQSLISVFSRKVEFYGGGWAWPMISHIAMPLAIFYRYNYYYYILCNILKIL